MVKHENADEVLRSRGCVTALQSSHSGLNFDHVLWQDSSFKVARLDPSKYLSFGKKG